MKSFARLLLCIVSSCGLLTAEAANPCPRASEIDTAHFVGNWSITWTAATSGQRPERGLLHLQTHPLYSDSLKGSLQRGTQTIQMVADWDDDTLTLEESVDGKHINATWQAQVVAGQCGRVLEGVRFTGSEVNALAQRFRMNALGLR